MSTIIDRQPLQTGDVAGALQTVEVDAERL